MGNFGLLLAKCFNLKVVGVQATWTDLEMEALLRAQELSLAAAMTLSWFVGIQG